MAQKVQVLLVDDIDGGTADETVTFGLDGVNYEIDLSTAHAKELRDAFGTWVGHARKISNRGTRSGSAGASRPRRNSDAGDVRAWAKENGYEVSERGRISAEIREAYAAAH
ncbi:Lsr2 family protein [Cellulomonas sp. NPDC089187]|uniref:histone-like nucleoid-structuring protein Lsr2 n=1 Tax=Cellulomonas sp. NPDC089187 TaxID=3154970 RepID=UPI003416AAB6